MHHSSLSRLTKKREMKKTVLIISTAKEIVKEMMTSTKMTLIIGSISVTKTKMIKTLLVRSWPPPGLIPSCLQSSKLMMIVYKVKSAIRFPHLVIIRGFRISSNINNNSSCSSLKPCRQKRTRKK